MNPYEATERRSLCALNYAPTELSAPVLCHGCSNNDPILAVPRNPIL
ncbi:hypothetical protein CCHR01_02775 [Colletotrichum chrysophilum]|uniref:Uncharacterized protein n=1 Tax=Colletotrichum chrysophilum TaxID=1836956 RepID=A0AAD9ES32_9PEZI|nr:hypothetical protein CCHR01_02775 [Colletotrichum chrysophilum]